MNRNCSCGCEHFRFKVDVTQHGAPLVVNTCTNCGHILKDHLQLKSSEQ